MAEPTFDRTAYQQRLTTRRLGRTLVARAEVESTNDVAWDALAAGFPDGTVVVADAQTRGRGRSGRRWHATPGRSLALSLLLHQGCGRRPPGTLSLVAGLGLARGLETLGVRARLKWPNDLLLGGRKLSGILSESRRVGTAGATASGAGSPVAGGRFSEAAVIGVGVNVSQQPQDFPPEIAAHATSLAIEGHPLTREAVAAAFLNALEPLWTEHAEGGPEHVLEAWSRRAEFWGRPVTVRTPSGPVTGVARALDPEGGLVLTLESGVEATVLAGDLEVAWPEGRE